MREIYFDVGGRTIVCTTRKQPCMLACSVPGIISTRSTTLLFSSFGEKKEGGGFVCLWQQRPAGRNACRADF
jgi:hypothetical protein